MSEGAMGDTGPAESRAESCARLVGALCDEFGAEAVAAAAIPRLPGYRNPVVTEAAGRVAVGNPVSWVTT